MAETLLVRWAHDKHILVSAESAGRLGRPAGTLLKLNAGLPFPMNAAEAMARLDAGEADLEIVEAAELKAAREAADQKAAEQAKTAVILTDQGEKGGADHEADLQGEA